MRYGADNHEASMKQPEIYFKQLEIGPMANFIYLIGDPATREACVVDPAWDVYSILQVAEKDGYQVKNILVSHGHPDHINGVEELMNRTNARLYMHKDEVPWIRGWKATATKTSDGDTARVGELEVRFLHTPGHTPGSQCFVVGPRLVSGDTLFIDSCGRTDLPGGDPKVMYDTLSNKLMRLPDDMVLFPGHNYAAETSVAMGSQKKTNPVLRAATLDAFLHMMGPRAGM